MSRPLRIQFPGAWYHVMNRGRRGEPVFSKKEDYEAFTGLLEELAEVYNVKVAAYCPMPNYYEEVPESRHLAPDVGRIKGEVCGLYEVDQSELYVSRRGSPD